MGEADKIKIILFCCYGSLQFAPYTSTYEQAVTSLSVLWPVEHCSLQGGKKNADYLCCVQYFCLLTQESKQSVAELRRGRNMIENSYILKFMNVSWWSKAQSGKGVLSLLNCLMFVLEEGQFEFLFRFIVTNIECQ